jgi:ankyrin repeat protein
MTCPARYRHCLCIIITMLLLSACSMTTSPLHSMILNGRDQDALRMIEQKKMINDRDQLGYTPLHIATIHGNQPVVEALLQSGAYLNARDFHGRTPLMLSLREGHHELARYLLDRGTRLHTNYTLTNALFDAITGNNLEMTRYLLQQGFSVNTTNRAQTTPIHIAAARGNVEILDLLILQGADIDQRDDADWSALHFAAAQVHREAVRRLLTAGARPTRLSGSALEAYATGVIYEESALAGAAPSEFLIAAEHFADAAAQYQSLSNKVEQEIEAQHARNALAMVLGAFASAIQPGTPMPTAQGSTVYLYQPVVVPIKGTATLHSTRDAYLASMRDALDSEQRCMALAGKR